MASKPRERVSFSEDFRRFFQRGLAALLPTLITLWLLVWAWNFLWESLGRHIIFGIKWMWLSMAEGGLVSPAPATEREPAPFPAWERVSLPTREARPA